MSSSSVARLPSPNVMPLATNKPRSLLSTKLTMRLRQDLQPHIVTSTATSKTSAHAFAIYSSATQKPDSHSSTPPPFSVTGTSAQASQPAAVAPPPLHRSSKSWSNFVALRRDECHIPQPVLTLFVYLAQQGVYVNDLFRRPGNINQIKRILQKFASGQPICWDEYNVYTVANVAKKLLLAIPDGLFGVRGEAQLIATAGSSCATELAELSSGLRTGASGGVTGKDETNSPPSSGDNAKDWTRALPLFVPLPAANDQRSVTFTDAQLSRSAAPKPCWPRGSIQQLYPLTEVSEKRIAVFLRHALLSSTARSRSPRVLETLPPSHQQLAILMLGILHQLVFHSASVAAKSTLHSMLRDMRQNSCESPNPLSSDGTDGCAVSSITTTTPTTTENVPLLTLAEGVVKSVAGALFHTCSVSVAMVEQAAQVLRTLVICFPAMGESLTRFYLDAVADSLRSPVLCPQGISTTATELPSSGFIGHATPCGDCVLCPDTDHGAYFDHHSLDSDHASHICPVNLLQAASRLFCLSASPTTQPSAKPSTLRARLGCPPFVCKANTNSSSNSSSGGSNHHIIANTTSSPVSYSPPADNGVDDSTGLTANLRRPSPPLERCPYDELLRCQSEFTVEPSKYEIAFASNTSTRASEPISERYTTLRRNQSRYRSLRRRQMENLSRRAEWFLGPTTLPVLTLTPLPGTPTTYDAATAASGGKGETTCSDNGIIIITSTVSLLDLDRHVDMGCPGQASQPLLTLPVPPPQVLYTASTGELEHHDFEDSASPSTHDAHRAHGVRRTDSGRHRLLSVGSYLEASPADSYFSVYSAPSGRLHRCEAGRAAELEEDYYHRGLTPMVLCNDESPRSTTSPSFVGPSEPSKTISAHSGPDLIHNHRTQHPPSDIRSLYLVPPTQLTMRSGSSSPTNRRYDKPMMNRKSSSPTCSSVYTDLRLHMHPLDHSSEASRLAILARQRRNSALAALQTAARQTPPRGDASNTHND